MPYWLESDTFHEDPVWEALAAGHADQLDRLQAAYCRLKSQSSHNLSDGYLTEQAALRLCRGRRPLLDLLCTPVLDRSPLVHRHGDQCSCLVDQWVDGYAYRLHKFLARNPSRKEYDRSRAQRADLRDARLKASVYARDGGCCRYCRSGPLSPKAGRARDRRRHLTYDHVDPDQPGGVDGANLVTACGRCNEHKGKRTPNEADMVLLPVPPAELAAAWRARGQMLYDPAEAPEPVTDQPRITDESASDHRSDHEHDQKPVSDPIGDPIGDRDDDPIDDATPSVRPDPIGSTSDQRSNQRSPGSGLGRGGKPDPDSPPPHDTQPSRTPQHPDIYHRRSRAAPPPPEYIWPPGAVPASPCDHEEGSP